MIKAWMVFSVMFLGNAEVILARVAKNKTEAIS